MKVWVQKWEESERGWGTRPDGYTLHLTKEDIPVFLSDMRKHERELYNGSVPDEYSRPCGDPYESELELGDKVLEVMRREHGIWGYWDNKYPDPL